MKRERREPDQGFGERVAAQQVLPALRPAAAQPGADRHPAHEQGEHQRLRVRRVAEEQLEVMAPDRLVDEARETGYGEEQKKDASGYTAHGFVAGREDAALYLRA